MWPGRIIRAFSIGLLAAAVLDPTPSAAVESMPKFDVSASCKAAAAGARNSDYVKICLQKEREAQAKIEQTWADFKAPDKDHCMQLSRLGGQPTYTELLTCLELARDVRTLHQETPAAASSAPRQPERGTSTRPAAR